MVSPHQPRTRRGATSSSRGRSPVPAPGGEPDVAQDRSCPVWLLDVDGVVNAQRPGWSAPPHHTVAYNTGTAYKIRWAPALTERVRALHDSGRVEVRWATTWCRAPAQLEAAFGFPPLARTLSDADCDPGRAPAAKLREAHAVLEAENRPLIWTDDEAIPITGPARDRLEAAPRPALLIAPAPNRGLQPGHLDQIEDFLRACGR